jgi:PKD repeat protein
MPAVRRLRRTAPFAVLALILILPAFWAGSAAAARKHHAPRPGIGHAVVMPDKPAKGKRLHVLPAAGASVRRFLHHGFLHHGAKAKAPRRPHGPRAACPDPTCNLTYHGGALVLGPHTTHVVYWQPPGFTVTANYHSLIERFLTDVAADSGRATNVYATDTQYDDSTSTFIQYQQTFGGTLTDTNAFPATASGCPTTDGTITVPNCLTQTQEATELDNFLQANSMPRGIDQIYFLVLPDNVETCVDDFSDCGNILNLSPRYCAYHSSFDFGNGLTLWANEPYIGFASGHCNSGDTTKRPNGDVTDHELNVISHEHNETITDPTNGGWFDTNGAGENGDKCNFDFGTRIANNGTGDYNQLINHNPYEIQQEWSNAITGCALNFGAVAPTASFTWSPSSPSALDPVAFDGTSSHSNNSGGYIIDYQWNFGDGGTGSGATPTHTYAAAGTYTVTLTVEDDAGLTATTSQTVTVSPRATVTTYTGATTGDYHDSVTLSGTLTDSETSNPVPNETITFTLGSESCSATTDLTGSASCDVVLTQIPGAYTVTAAFAGDTVYGPSSDSAPFTITKEETTITYTGPTVILSGGTMNVTATLLEDGSVPPSPAGQTVTFALDGQTCSGTTDASGHVGCSINVSGSLGPKTITVTFAGDDYYLGSSDSAQVVVFAFPSRGAFALGDQTVAGAGAGDTVTWWSHSWSSLNSLSGGLAPPAFKGFAADVSTLPQQSPAEVCGTSFTTRTGNSGNPPDTVPSYMGVLVASSVTQSGSTVSGTWGSIVIVHTDPGYGPNPGHPGTGTIVATFC